MCAVFGFLDYKGKVSKAVLKKLIHYLSVAAEVRGTDATGIAYVRDGSMVTYKKPKPAHKVKLFFPRDTRAVIGHTRFTTQGSEKRNCNNHPFEGRCGKESFALAHNGVLYNDKGLRREQHLPPTSIENEPSIVYAGKKYTEYEVSQMQRAGERKVRAAKRRAIAMQSAMGNAKDDTTKEALSGDYAAAASKLKQLEADLRDFCKQTGRRNDTFRQQVHGFGRSEAQRAVQAAKRQQQASQTAGNVVSGHAVEVTPPTPKNNGGTGTVYLPEKISQGNSIYFCVRISPIKRCFNRLGKASFF